MIWIEFENGEEGYFYKRIDDRIFYKRRACDAKIYTSLFQAGFDTRYELSGANIRQTKVITL